MNTPPIPSLHINTERTWRGGERQTLLLVTGLRERGHPTELVCPPGSPLAERARAQGVPVHEVTMRGEADIPAVLRIRAIIREGTFAVCQLHTSHAHTLGVLARGRRATPRTVVTRRVDFSIHRRGLTGLLRLNALKYRFGVDRYIAISRAIREVMIGDGIAAERIAVVHSGVPELPTPAASRAEIRERHGIPANAPVVGNIAHLAAHKGQRTLVEALARLRPEFPELRLLIVGEGGERGTIEAEIERRRVADRVILAGFREDVAGYLDSFDLFCMPSLQEGLCTSNLDALARGLPVVASRTGGIPEAVRDGESGLLADPGDADDLARSLARLLRDRALAKRLGRRGRELAREEFSIEATIEGTLHLYRSLRSDPAAAPPATAES